MSQRTFLITGGCGFAGSHMCEHLLKNTKDKVIVADSLTYSGNMDRLRDVKLNPELISSGSLLDAIKLYTWDFRQPAEPNLVKELQDVTHIIHMGAESHVDNSISDPMRFVAANVVGTVNVLNLARELSNLELFVYFSTDEVFGPAPMKILDGPLKYTKSKTKSDLPEVVACGVKVIHGDEEFQAKVFTGYKEKDRHDPKNPYAATKSAGEQMVTSFANTYGLPCVITRTMNIVGERQHPEKFFPLVISRALSGELVQIHATPDKKHAGVRTYIHARNVADAVLHVVNLPDKDTKNVEAYHIRGEEELDNLTFAKLIAESVGYEAEQLGMVAEGFNYELVDFHSSRPGHDLRYALDGSKMKALGWEPPKSLRESIRKTVRWYLENPKWLK